MRITLLGTGTSLPDNERVQSGILVEAGHQLLLLDIGSGVLHRLTQLRAPISQISEVFISHFHIDHCSDFMSMCQTMWLSGFNSTLQVHGPPHITDWFRCLQDVQFPYLKDKIRVQVNPLGESAVIKLDDGAVRACSSAHGTTDARAFRIEHEGRAAFFSSDTAPSKRVAELAKGADVMIHECNWLDGEHPTGVHTSPSELAAVAAECAPSKVVLTHLGPEVISHSREVVRIVGRETDAKIIVGRDLLRIDI